MRWLILLSVTMSGCSDAGQPAAGQAPSDNLAPVVIGRLQDSNIAEASGLARSQRSSGVLWTHNDSGADEWLHALGLRGERLGEFDLHKSTNVDWEDLASFTLDGKPYLLVADIGDNESRHERRSLYIVAEPPVQKNGQSQVAWRVDFVYPNGPRDTEAVAVDTDNRRALLLSKRDIPPLLYEVPLLAETDDIVTAKRLGAITSLPRPSRRDIEFAPKTKDWHWQPVGMDISQDNMAAVIATYRAVYFYEREPGQDWFEALNTAPLRVSIRNFRNAEAIAFGDMKRTVVVTGEARNSPLLAIDFNKEASE